MVEAITTLGEIEHSILTVSLEQAVATLAPGATVSPSPPCVWIWRHPDTDVEVHAVFQGNLTIVVAPTGRPQEGQAITTTRSGLAEADAVDRERMLAHLRRLHEHALVALRHGCEADVHNQTLVDAVAALCALHPDAKRAFTAELTVASDGDMPGLIAMSNVERVDLRADLVEWVMTRARALETFSDHFGEDASLRPSRWRASIDRMDQGTARQAILHLPEHLRDAVIAVRPR